MIGMLFVQPVIGLTSDRIGRKPFIIGGSIGLLALAIPCFILINSNVIGLISSACWCWRCCSTPSPG